METFSVRHRSLRKKSYPRPCRAGFQGSTLVAWYFIKWLSYVQSVQVLVKPLEKGATYGYEVQISTLGAGHHHWVVELQSTSIRKRPKNESYVQLVYKRS